MYVATIVEDKNGNVHIRLGKSAQDGGGITVVDVLNGDDLRELKGRAERFVKDLLEKRQTTA